MRVIAGTARGRRLQSVPGDSTRPITDRAKEALFSILGADVPGARVLDLFAGTGGVGIEALSRGAAWADFIDLAAPAVRTIQANLSATGLATSARVWRVDAFAFLARPPAESYDLVYVAPPQYQGLWLRALTAIDAAPGWLVPDGLVVVQIHPREEEATSLSRLRLYDTRRYGSVMLQFYVAEELPPALPRNDSLSGA
jgi:16S rRNA (guanine(966)-N(2))-methyltransferase RsmD